MSGILSVFYVATAAWAWSVAAGIFVELTLIFYPRLATNATAMRLLTTAVRIHQEAWIAAPVWPAWALIVAAQARDVSGIIWGPLFLFMWWRLRNWPSGNVWKRRGRKARERIAERAGRLTVVPEPA